MKKVYLAIASMILATMVVGCADASEIDNKNKEIEKMNVEIAQLEEDNADLKRQVESLILEKELLEHEMDKLNEEPADNEDEEPDETYESVPGIISEFAFEDRADEGLAVSYIFEGKKYNQILDYASEVGAELYSMKWDYSYSLNDVNSDGVDEVLINMYYENNVADDVCTSVVYAINENGELYTLYNMQKASLPENWFVYSSSSLAQDGIHTIGLWKNPDTYEMEGEVAVISYENGEWVVHKQ